MPLCFGNADGNIRVEAAGGNGFPFTYNWFNTNDTIISQVDSTGSIPSGQYKVVASDKAGCSDTVSFTILDPPLLKPNIPSLITICSNQTYTADAGIPNGNYLWHSDNGFTSISKTPVLTAAGTYFLNVTDAKGCSGKDTLNLVKESNIIDANFLIPSKASVGDTIVLIEMSWPVPQDIQWHYPASFIPIYQNEYSIYLVPQKVGIDTIGLISFVSVCSQYIEKTIIIEPARDKEKPIYSAVETITKFTAYPNPNRGSFTVDVVLTDESEVLVELYSVYGKRLVVKQGRGFSSYKFDFNLNLMPGIYLVRISSGNDFRSLRVIIDK